MLPSLLFDFTAIALLSSTSAYKLDRVMDLSKPPSPPTGLPTAVPPTPGPPAGAGADDIKNFGVLLFPGFTVLDVFGPMEALNTLSRTRTIHLEIVARSLDPVSCVTTALPMNKFNSTFSQSVVPTSTTEDNVPLDVLLVPGGGGTRATNLQAEIAYIKRVFPTLKYLITVCTGSALAAQAGVLDGRKATTNKAAFNWVASLGPKTNWISHARWVTDGNVWTSSGVSAGIDATLAWMEFIYGSNTTTNVANGMEYVRHSDWRDDPFADLYGVKDIPAKE